LNKLSLCVLRQVLQDLLQSNLRIWTVIGTDPERFVIVSARS
jgi:hypothetical protein